MNNSPGETRFPSTITVGETAKRFGCSDKKVYQMISDQTIPPRLVVKLGKMIRLLENELAEWFASGGSRAIA